MFGWQSAVSVISYVSVSVYCRIECEVVNGALCVCLGLSPTNYTRYESTVQQSQGREIGTVADEHACLNHCCMIALIASHT